MKELYYLGDTESNAWSTGIRYKDIKIGIKRCVVLAEGTDIYLVKEHLNQGDREFKLYKKDVFTDKKQAKKAFMKLQKDYEVYKKLETEFDNILSATI